MTSRIHLALPLIGAMALPVANSRPVMACCPAPPSGQPVVNADQTVLMIWDPATKTQHFIRQASFRSAADDFGFLVPTPTQPELDESGNEAFATLRKLTEPEVQRVSRRSGGMGCGCADAGMPGATAPKSVRVLQEKLVAGFNATVLEADSATELTTWLKEHGYAYSPEIAAWAKPYVDGGWKITALKIAKSGELKANKTVAAAALRLSFKTDRPVFPYREPDSAASAKQLDARQRLLRIYFVTDGRYQGELTKEEPWTGRVAWAGKVRMEDRKKTLEMLKLPVSTGPENWWLTEFEDNWPYRVAPADVYFARADSQDPVRRAPIIVYTSETIPNDVMAFALAGAVCFTPFATRLRRRSRR